MTLKKKEFFTISNLLSIIRLLLVFPIIILFNYWGDDLIRESIIFLLILAGITDILDGYLARKLNQITEFGKIIDPIADKVLVAAVVIQLVNNDLLPLYYVVLIILRDILILIGGIYVSKLTGKIIQSNYIGKITVLIVGFVILLRLLNFQQDELIFDLVYYLSIIMIITSFLVYLIRAIKFVRSENEHI